MDRSREISMLARLEQICSNFVSEGYRRTGKMGAVRALKHPNGNRITLIGTENDIGILKNGRLVKREPITVHATDRNAARP